MRTTLILASILALTIGCSKTDPLYCDEDTMCAEGLPYCDLNGEHPESEGVGNTCIDYPWDAGPPMTDGAVTDASDTATDAARGDAGTSSRIVLFAAGNYGGPNRVYESKDGAQPQVIWSSPESDNTLGISLGDFEGDGDLDVAVANAGKNRVYENLSGTFMLIWSSAEADVSHDVDWIDYDKDGDLDLSFANAGGNLEGEPNRIYRNDNGTLVLAWSDSQMDASLGISWADFDNDGDADMAVANAGVDRVYRNLSSTFSTNWASTVAELSDDIAWADFDGDGDPELAVATSAFFNSPPNRVYDNENQSLSVTWSSPEEEKNTGVAVGDFDGDGDPDLVFSSALAETRIYRRTGADFSLFWTIESSDWTNDASWCDLDGDGDLELLLANGASQNGPEPNRAYLLQGSSFQLSWSTTETDHTEDIDVYCPPL